MGQLAMAQNSDIAAIDNRAETFMRLSPHQDPVARPAV